MWAVESSLWTVLSAPWEVHRCRDDVGMWWYSWHVVAPASTEHVCLMGAGRLEWCAFCMTVQAGECRHGTLGKVALT
jgi:hypothetical protein